ncbi:unnamed protein product [Haemonchus placei]|uniref:Ribonucleases P/MRP protein subunit POP1 n=1 Tax=Haemonchus placei TaxID=6290 RepID=A0A0N4WQZ5_HAEPC|nr:unnamed protein product [Haemonchus placei]
MSSRMPKTSIYKTRVGTELLMGKVVKLSNVGIDRVPCAQVRCSMNEFNRYLKMYFARAFEFWALDRESKGNLGDMVLIRRIPVDQRPTTNVAHLIDRVVFKYGNIVDPVTGRRVIKDEFADEIELRKHLVEQIVDAPLEQYLTELVFVEMESDDLSKARFVKVYDYLEERAAQVADLLQVVDNSNLVSGEVTKGPRTAAQRLPRHMRRRAMAYDVRRFPKGLRNYAAPFLANTKHRKKPPSRYFRRRSRNLLLNYIRRQRKMVWLETHIWHAKRFHIVDRWGYRLPDRSFQRNFRPCYRDSVRHCTVRDKSYLSCILISHRKQDELIAMLSPLCVNSASPTFAFKSGLDVIQVSTLIYHPGQYPQGLIGPARFLWSKEGFVVPVQDLRDQLVRIRLYGPLSVSIVSDALKLVDDEKAPQFRFVA